MVEFPPNGARALVWTVRSSVNTIPVSYQSSKHQLAIAYNTYAHCLGRVESSLGYVNSSALYILLRYEVVA